MSNTRFLSDNVGECPLDPGGYFVVKGTERVRSFFKYLPYDSRCSSWLTSSFNFPACIYHYYIWVESIDLLRCVKWLRFYDAASVGYIAN